MNQRGFQKSQAPLVHHQVTSSLVSSQRTTLTFHITATGKFPCFFLSSKIVALKESISLKLRGNPSPFDFDQPHSNELLSDCTPVTPAEVSKLLQTMSNKSSQLDYIPTSLMKSCANISPSSFHIWQIFRSPKPISHQNSNWHSSRHF